MTDYPRKKDIQVVKPYGESKRVIRWADQDGVEDTPLEHV